MANFETPNEQIELSIENQESKTEKSSDEPIKEVPHEPEIVITPELFKAISDQIRELEVQVKTWRKKRDELNSQVKEKTKNRNQKNFEVKNLIKEANDHKSKRDELNKQISVLKDQKQILDLEISEYEKIFEETDEKSEPIEIPKNINFTVKKLQKEIKELEWKLQTQTLHIDEERRLVNYIADLDVKLEDLLSIHNLNKDKLTKFKKLRYNKRSLHKILKEMRLLVKESREHHKLMLEIFATANSMRKEADLLHSELSKVNIQADMIHAEYVEKVAMKKALRNKIHKFAQDQKDKEYKALKEKTQEKTNNVLQKTKDGKKISFDDFKNLIDRGLI